MLHLMQLLNMIDDKKLFKQVFNDLDFELNEMGWNENPTELINDLLDNHFGLYIEDKRQLAEITKTILNTEKLNRAINTSQLLNNEV